jgi:hypothetical protein
MRTLFLSKTIPKLKLLLWQHWVREESNKYAVHSCNNMYLSRDGSLLPSIAKVIMIPPKSVPGKGQIKDWIKEPNLCLVKKNKGLDKS